MIHFTNIRRAPVEIGQILAKNKQLVGYLCDDSQDPQPIQGTYTELANSHYINFYPPTETAIKDVDRNAFCVILLDAITQIDDDNTRASIAVYGVVDINHINLTGNRSRALEIVDEIVRSLDGVKLTCAGAMQVGSISYLVIDTNHIGYRISVTVTDQSEERAEI
jgi:hypothetical protein